jgi:hypothetical protein
MVINASFNNISVISWQSALMVEETTDLPQVTGKLNQDNVSEWSDMSIRGLLFQ